MYRHCEYKDHTAAEGVAMFCYIDEPHGITDNMHICEDCYLEHLQRYYPDSRVTIYLAKQKESDDAN